MRHLAEGAARGRRHRCRRRVSRAAADKDERAQAIERGEIERLAKDRDDERAILERLFRSVRNCWLAKLPPVARKDLAGSALSDAVLDEYNPVSGATVIDDDAVMDYLEGLKAQFDGSINELQARFENKVDKLQRGDELPPGVMKMVKVFVAVKRKLQPGDKMAGRHGNKGVISKINPQEDMPYLEDGTPVDIVLNPLGVPSRMNVGQILETHLGWASHGLGRQISQMLETVGGKTDVGDIKNWLEGIYDPEQYANEIKPLEDREVFELAGNLRKGVPMGTPVFDGAREDDVVDMLRNAGLHDSGQVTLIDGRTGEVFDHKVTVGYIYMLKLHHLVDDKIHARRPGRTAW